MRVAAKDGELVIRSVGMISVSASPTAPQAKCGVQTSSEWRPSCQHASHHGGTWVADVAAEQHGVELCAVEAVEKFLHAAGTKIQVDVGQPGESYESALLIDVNRIRQKALKRVIAEVFG